MELEDLLDRLPPHIQEPLKKRKDLNALLEIVLDLGREPEARFRDETILLSAREVTEEDIRYVTDRISAFGEDNRAGIERTLHRISAIRNRSGKVVGLTLRVGRAIHGTIKVIEDLVFSGKSVLLLGKPGVGKTTMLREVARVLSDEAKKRVVVVDTSNEIAGDGDIPHPGIGRARRMQVARPDRQHAVMIEAVENHMPEVIIIDEIGNEHDTAAARTIAERGVQLVATAHGNNLDNLIMNPTLSDLVGGVQSVTLGDEEARRRRTQKTILERRAPPTFDILVEIQNWNEVSVHPDVAEIVDRLLRGVPVTPEKRQLISGGELKKSRAAPPRSLSSELEAAREPVQPRPTFSSGQTAPAKQLAALGVSKDKLRKALELLPLPIQLTNDLDQANLILTTKTAYRRMAKTLGDAERRGIPVHILRKNTEAQIQHFLNDFWTDGQWETAEEQSARKEAEEAVARVKAGERQVHLMPHTAYLRRLQHVVAEKMGMTSSSLGQEPARHVVLYR